MTCKVDLADINTVCEAFKTDDHRLRTYNEPILVKLGSFIPLTRYDSRLQKVMHCTNRKKTGRVVEEDRPRLLRSA